MHLPNPRELPALTHVLETILYVRSLERSRDFYSATLGLKPLSSATADRAIIYPLGNTTLLLFRLGATEQDANVNPDDPTFRIPRHGPSVDLLHMLGATLAEIPPEGIKSSLRQHFCLAAPSRSDVEQWEEYLLRSGVKVVGRMNWERGGYSVYFEDPDGHVGEIASRGIWPHY